MNNFSQGTNSSWKSDLEQFQYHNRLAAETMCQDLVQVN
jgi:hypothetical protein